MSDRLLLMSAIIHLQLLTSEVNIVVGVFLDHCLNFYILAHYRNVLFMELIIRRLFGFHFSATNDYLFGHCILSIHFFISITDYYNCSQLMLMSAN